ncbi:hypothetical protein TCE0_018r05968 [Talaromyces pinophilus]|uniref:Uncharacterized protein n=1 Tax=Talaromyces pinophilus TaxID=128442 RepID=A0A510NWS9_TALPI|nr:hypothetical protein TCE0_018r05968 [Talaromyces pinophilus]
MAGSLGNHIPTYHLAPNFSLVPPPTGMLDLGSIIDDLKNPDVINKKCRVDVPESERYNDQKKGFVASRLRMRKGEYGIWAKAVGIKGLGGEVSMSHEDSYEAEYRFKSIETIYFVADREYITQAMNQEHVRSVIKGMGYRPVYIITGLKIARGPAVSTKKEKKGAAKAEATFNQPGGVPADFGFRLNPSKEDSISAEFEESNDFIIGIRVKKVRYQMKGVFSRKPGELVIEKHDVGAELVGTDGHEERQEFPVEELFLDGEMAGMVELLDSIQKEKDDRGEETATSWILPVGTV